MKKADLVLGCNGREEHGICLCGGTSSVLLDIAAVPVTDRRFYDYMFKLMKLESRPITDYNAVINTLHFLKETYLTQQQYDLIGEWLRFHKRCGIYMYRSVYD